MTLRHMTRLLASALAPISLAAAPAQAAVDCRACETQARFYAAREDALAWTGAANARLFADLLRAVEAARTHGLDPADYHLAALEALDPTVANREADELATDAYLTLAAHLLAGRLDPATFEPDWTAARGGRDLAAYLQGALVSGAVSESLEALAPALPDYAALRAARTRYQTIAAEGGWPAIDAGPALHPGEAGPRVAQIRARLAATGDSSAPSETPDLFDDALAEAVRTFQARAGLDPDGVVGSLTLAELNATAEERVRQIDANLERWRWLPEDLGRRHIRVNIAGFRLAAWADGRVEREHDVIVGRPYRCTPVFSADMTYFVLNPWWETPPSLAVRDKLPAFRQDPGAVTRLGFQVIDRSGAVVDPATINWAETPAEDFPYRLRQAPGPHNALGEVKFIFPNPHNVYLHDTPSRELFARSRRDFSSGCVRVNDALDLAAWVAAETEGWTRERIGSVASGDVETRVSLAHPLPVHILYWTAIPDETAGARFVNDLYEQDPPMIAALDAPPPPPETR